MEKERSDELSVENLEMNFRRFRDRGTEYTISKLVKLLMGEVFVDRLGYDDDKLDVFYVSFIINVIENFVSSENNRELLFALNGFLEGYDSLSVGDRYKTYMDYAPPLNNKIKRSWSDPNKQFHYLEEPIEKTLANRLYGDISRNDSKKLKAIANQVISELNESPGGFPKSPKLRPIRELPQIQANNVEEKPPSADEIGKEDAENRKETSLSDSKEDTTAEINSSLPDECISNDDNEKICSVNDNNRSNDMIRSDSTVDPENAPTVISLPEMQTIASAEKVKALSNRFYIFVVAVVMVFLAGIAIFLTIKAQSYENTVPDEGSDSLDYTVDFNSYINNTSDSSSLISELSGSEETSGSEYIPNYLEIETPEGLSREVNGDRRSPYTTYQIKRGILGNKIVFNSISNSDPIGGDERNFIAARENTANQSVAANKWTTSDVVVEDGKEYIIRLYVHNNNPTGFDAVATNTKVAFGISTTSSRQVQVDGFISADNAEPNIYWGHINFIAEQSFHLNYIYGSALLENEGIGKDGGIKLGDNIITKKTNGGVLIGYDDLDGCVPGGYEYQNYVTICVKAVFDTDYRIENQVRLVGGAEIWGSYVIAEIGDIVEFRISYKNISTTDMQNQVAIRNLLPKSLEYVPDTTKIVNATYPNSTMLTPGEAIVTDGINIGNYGAGSNAYIYLRAKVVEDGLADGKNTLVSWAQGGVGDKTIQDYAGVIVNKSSETS